MKIAPRPSSCAAATAGDASATVDAFGAPTGALGEADDPATAVLAPGALVDEALDAALAFGGSVGAGVTTGAAVGAGVVAAVGCGVGTGVGGAVGAGVAAASTVIVPVIDGWIAQWYANVPATVNVNVNVAPVTRLPLPPPPLKVTVCVAASLFVHATLSPAFTVSAFGAKAKFWMLTALVVSDGAALAVVAMPSVKRSAAPNTRRARRADTIRAVPVASAPFAALAREATRVGLDLLPEQVSVCERYAEELIERNTSVNLTAITAPADIAHKHFLDSWTAFAARRWTGRERVVDVGSGAGFPGLALRIARPELRVTLVESVGKKARFLEDVCALLGLADVEVRNERAEVLGHERRDRYDVGTARAVGTLGQVIEYLLPLLRVGGDAIVWKGRIEHELDGARKACSAIGGEITRVVTTSELGLDEVLPGRSLVVVRKTRPTPVRFPRSAAEARRRPW